MAGKKKAKKAKETLKHSKKHLKASKRIKPKKNTSKHAKKHLKASKVHKPGHHKKPKKHVHRHAKKPGAKPKHARKPRPKHRRVSKPPARPVQKPAAKPVAGPAAKPAVKPPMSGAEKLRMEANVEHYVDDVVLRIKNVEIQGANDIAEAGVRALKVVVEKSPATNRKSFIEDLEEAAEKLRQARPTEPALRNAINTITKSVGNYELRSMENVRKHAMRQADRFLKELSEVVDTISRIGAEEIRDGDVIITHCHSEHVVGILQKAKEKRKRFRVIVTETQPLKQGLMTAKELSGYGIDVTYIIDSAAATVMKQATKMIVGADAILADGSVVNKIGTYALALLAKQFQTPVFVAAETIKFDPVTIMGAAEPIEQRGPEEIIDPQEIKRVHILNPAYDVTPAELIDALITEKGIMRPGLIRECST